MSKETFLTISIATGDKPEPNKSVVDSSYIYPPASLFDIVLDSGKYTSDMILNSVSGARHEATLNIDRLEREKVELIKLRCKEEQKLNTLTVELKDAIAQYKIQNAKQMARNTTIVLLQDNLKRVLRSIEFHNKSITHSETTISIWENAKNIFQEYIHTCISAIEVEKLTNISRKINVMSLTQTINRYNANLQRVIDEMAGNLDKLTHPDILANEQASRNGITVASDKVDESFNAILDDIFTAEPEDKNEVGVTIVKPMTKNSIKY